MCEKICLTLLNGTGYVFKVDDYMHLRREYRIVGCLVGTTNERGSAANEFRLPAELTIHETRLLIENNVAELVSKRESLLRAPTPEELAACAEKAAIELAKQTAQSRAEKLRNATLNIQKILQGKRKKLQKEGAMEAAINLTAEDVLLEVQEQFVFEKENALLEIHCAHVEPHAVVPVSLPNFTKFDELKYRVFHDFWQRYKFVTPGDTFGADFLIYPGDPLIYHATHIVIVIDKPAKMNLLHLVAKARLAVIVNKICILAYAGIDDCIHYQTIEWDGNMEQQETMTTEKTTQSVASAMEANSFIDKIS